MYVCFRTWKTTLTEWFHSKATAFTKTMIWKEPINYIWLLFLPHGLSFCRLCQKRKLNNLICNLSHRVKDSWTSYKFFYQFSTSSCGGSKHHDDFSCFNEISSPPIFIELKDFVCDLDLSRALSKNISEWPHLTKVL